MSRVEKFKNKLEAMKNDVSDSTAFIKASKESGVLLHEDRGMERPWILSGIPDISWVSKVYFDIPS